MASDLLTAKLGRAFDHIDSDGNGQIDENDYVLMGERVAAALGHPADSPPARRVRDGYLALWRDRLVTTLPPGRTGLDRDQFVAALRSLIEGDGSASPSVVDRLAGMLLENADLDADGWVTPEEFRTFQRAHFPAVTDADVQIAFSRLDTDGDGVLSAEEFVRTTVDFWTSTDPEAPGNWWLGPVPDVLS